MTRQEALSRVLDYLQLESDAEDDPVIRQSIADIITALRTPHTVHDVVRVKELEWDEDPSKSGAHRAHVWFRTYYIAWPRGNWELLEIRSPGMVIRAHGTADSLSAAQAVCQAHHERMVMDMLEIVP